MKVKKHLQIDAIMNSTGRLPSDMENLEVYHQSSSTGEPINVGEMDLTYLIRAFAKCQRQLSQEVRIDTQEGKVKELEKANSLLLENDSPKLIEFKINSSIELIAFTKMGDLLQNMSPSIDSSLQKTLENL